MVKQTSTVPPQISPIRLTWIDAAKGVAISFVLLGHSHFIHFALAHEDSPIISCIFKLLILAAASFMSLFYFLSGFTFKVAPNPLSKRFSRLLLPYFGWGIIYLICNIGFAYVEHNSAFSILQSAGGLIYSRFCIFPFSNEASIPILPQGAHPLWFLTSLFTAYILFLPIIKYSKFSGIIILCYIVATFLFSFSPVLLPWSLDTAPAGAIFLYAGYKLKQTNFFDLSKARMFTTSVLLLAIYTILVKTNGIINMSVREYGQFPYFSPFLFIIIGLIGSLIYCNICIMLNKIKLMNMFSWLGKNSLTLLCCHPLAFFAVLLLFSPRSPFYSDVLKPTEYLFILELPAAILMTALLSFATDKLKMVRSGRHKHA